MKRREMTSVREKLPATPRGYLPPWMRILFVTGPNRTGGWLAESFADDSAAEIRLEEALGMASGLEKLRHEVFDVVLVSHEVNHLDALEFLAGLRAVTSDDQPIVILGSASEQEMAAVCYEAGADAYVCAHTTTMRTLMWKLALAMERHELVTENRRLNQDQTQRLEREHDESLRLLNQQKAMIRDAENFSQFPSSAASAQVPCSPNNDEVETSLSSALVEHYRELLRAYVIMGTGNLNAEMLLLVNRFTSESVTARQAMGLHLTVLEETILGLGSRSARHVMNRADMLILEVTINLADRYREVAVLGETKSTAVDSPRFNCIA